MKTVDTLIHAQWIVPVEPLDSVLERHSLVIDEGRIRDILPSDAAREHYEGRTSLELREHCLIPGLVNAHTHAAMSLLRGLADDLPLMEWLKAHIWPAEQRWLSEEFVHDGTQLAMAEMLRGGTTCINDMYMFPDVTARAVLKAGMRCCIGLVVFDFPTPWAQDANDYITKGLALRDRHKGEALLSTALAPHAPYTVDKEALQRIGILANELDIPVHMHIHETADEVAQSMDRHGKRPLDYLDSLGLLTPSLLGVHMTQLDEAEIQRLAEAGCHVIHCPESNQKLASGVCPVNRLSQAGVNVALGTDGAASNNDLDMFGEMRSAALLGKTDASDAAALPAHEILRMATLNGARALGLGDETGSLLPGKAADVVAVRLADPETLPVYNPVSQLIYAAGRDKVTDVWVAGRHLLKNRALTTLDEAAIATKALEWGTRIAAEHA